MKRFLIILVTLLWCNVGFAEWTHIAETEESNQYIDEESIKKEDGITYFWILEDYKEENIPPSQIIYYAVKCESKQMQTVRYGWYDKNMGEGKFSGLNEWPLKDWVSPPPEAVGTLFIKSVCTFAEIMTLKCKNKNSKASHPYAIVEVDLKNKKLNYQLLGWPLNILTITPYDIQVMHIVEETNVIWYVSLDRYSGDLNVSNSMGDFKETPGNTISASSGSFKCKKVDKVF